LHRAGGRDGVEDVPFDHRQPRMPEQPCVLQAVAMVVVEDDDLVLIDEARREAGTDESGTAGEEDAFASEHDEQ
jgi:ribosomal protein S24E